METLYWKQCPRLILETFWLAFCFRMGYIIDMTLDEYLESNSISVADFAKKIGAKSRATVHRYLFKNGSSRIPNPRMMLKIMRATGGIVTPTDFYSRKHKSKPPCNHLAPA